MLVVLAAEGPHWGALGVASLPSSRWLARESCLPPSPTPFFLLQVLLLARLGTVCYKLIYTNV